MNQNGGSHGSSFGRFGGPYDRWVEPTEKSPLGRVQQQYWTTKQTLLSKLGKKEDEYVVASDSELDAKLELYGSVRDTCQDLERILGFYQDNLCALSQEENTLGRFLKEQGREDKTRAGKMMVAVGKTMSYTAQQRLSLRAPLVRLYQEVETFRDRAVKDTAVTVRSMERTRTEYRGTLMWMKDISQELDPDTYKQLEKFRKVQMSVRKNKQRFDKLKVDCLQKIDLLAASRCNMFSHALVLYQNALLQFWEKSARTMNHVADSFKGYQYYEFSVVRELCEPSRQLADKMVKKSVQPEAAPVSSADQVDGEAPGDEKDKLVFFESEFTDDSPMSSEPLPLSSASPRPAGPIDLLTHCPEVPDTEKEDRALLEEILAGPSQPAGPGSGPVVTGGTAAGASADLEDVFGGLSLGAGGATGGGAAAGERSAFLPSQLLSNGGGRAQPPQQQPQQPTGPGGRQTRDMSAWYSLFADLDPLANPDALGKQPGEEERNC